VQGLLSRPLLATQLMLFWASAEAVAKRVNVKIDVYFMGFAL
jgi:hypothetical protein